MRLPDNPAGFARFYQLVFERALPRHALEWVEALYAAQAAGKGAVVEAFRGSSKTTTLTVAFAAFRLGLDPHKSILLIQSSNDVAKRTCLELANLIEFNPGWKKAFPTIVPDHKVSWSAKQGWEVKDTDRPYAEWRALCLRTKGKDPSFIGFGYQSRAIIGKHPTAMLIVDDIHDETNTRSARRLLTVTDILKGTILPTLTPGAWQVFVGTPWTENDALAYLKSTGEYVCLSTPVYRVSSPPPTQLVISSERELAEGEQSLSRASRFAATREEIPNASLGNANPLEQKNHESIDIRNSTIENSVVLTWPERFPMEEIERKRRLVGASEFARMYLLDLAAAQGIYLRKEWLQGFPAERVQADWPVVMGVDYASAADRVKDGHRDYFAVAIGRAIPGNGGVVLVDGFRAQLTQGEAEKKLEELAAFYPNTQLIVVEAVGKGEEFFHLVRRESGLPVVSMQPGSSSKGERFQNAMAPLFEFGRARVMDLESPFLTAFRNEWLRWPRGDHDDTLDAVYWMLMAAKQHLARAKLRPKAANPFGAWGMTA